MAARHNDLLVDAVVAHHNRQRHPHHEPLLDFPEYLSAVSQLAAFRHHYNLGRHERELAKLYEKVQHAQRREWEQKKRKELRIDRLYDQVRGHPHGTTGMYLRSRLDFEKTRGSSHYSLSLNEETKEKHNHLSTLSHETAHLTFSALVDSSRHTPDRTGYARYLVEVPSTAHLRKFFFANIPAWIPERDRRAHTYIVGASRSGKTGIPENAYLLLSAQALLQHRRDELLWKKADEYGNRRSAWGHATAGGTVAGDCRASGKSGLPRSASQKGNDLLSQSL